MKRRPYIDLTGHLHSLQSSLTPDCRLFERASTRLRSTDPARDIPRLFIAFLVIFVAILAAYLAAVPAA